MSPAEMTYQQVIASPDMAGEVRGLPDAELIQLRRWLAGGGSRAEVAKKVQGLCIVVVGERFERRVEAVPSDQCEVIRKENARMRDLLIEANGICRSAAMISEREMENGCSLTNWQGFRSQLLKSLLGQHLFFYPDHYLEPKKEFYSGRLAEPMNTPSGCDRRHGSEVRP